MFYSKVLAFSQSCDQAKLAIAGYYQQRSPLMSVSGIFILDVKGRILIYRDYRGDVSTKYAERFMSKVNESEDSGKLSPVLHDEGVSYIYLQHSNVYLLAVTRQNVNATAVMVFLHRLIEVFKHYFEEVEEESIRDNFVTVYELLDEVC